MALPYANLHVIPYADIQSQPPHGMPVILRIERPHGVAFKDRIVVVQAAADVRISEQQVGHGKAILDTGRISSIWAGLGELGAKGEVAVGAPHRGGIGILNLGKVAAEVEGMLSLDQGEIVIETYVVVCVVADTIIFPTSCG